MSILLHTAGMAADQIYDLYQQAGDGWRFIARGTTAEVNPVMAKLPRPPLHYVLVPVPDRWSPLRVSRDTLKAYPPPLPPP